MPGQHVDSWASTVGCVCRTAVSGASCKHGYVPLASGEWVICGPTSLSYCCHWSDIVVMQCAGRKQPHAPVDASCAQLQAEHVVLRLIAHALGQLLHKQASMPLRPLQSSCHQLMLPSCKRLCSHSLESVAVGTGDSIGLSGAFTGESTGIGESAGGDWSAVSPSVVCCRRRGRCCGIPCCSAAHCASCVPVTAKSSTRYHARACGRGMISLGVAD